VSSLRRTFPLLALLLAGCRDTTAPTPSLAISFSVNSLSYALSETPDGLRMDCDVILTASARGSGTATWIDGVMRFYVGAQRAAPIDSFPVSLADLNGAWGATMTAADRPRSEWIFSASVPADVEVEVRYATDGSADIQSAKTRFSCGPTAPAGSYPAPTIGQIVVSPATGEVQPGDGFDVTYTATGSYPLWSTTVVASGAFQLRKEFPANGETSVTRTVHVDVPPGSMKNVPIAITVLAADGALQQGSRGVQTQTVVVDRTPPVLSDVNYIHIANLAGQFAVGDSLWFTVNASDNDEVSWFLWELGAPANVRDSVRAPVVGGIPYWFALLPVTPAWVGAPILSLRARDASGLESNVLSSTQDSLRFYPLLTHPTTAVATGTASTSAFPNLGDLVYDAKRNVFYIVMVSTNEIAVLDVATMTFRTPIKVASPAGGLDLSVSGDSLLVTLPASKSLAVVDLAQPAAPPSTIALSVLDTAGTSSPNSAPMLVRVAANGKAVVTLAYTTRAGDDIVTVDLKTGGQAIRSDGRKPYAFGVVSAGITPDRSRLLMFDYNCPRSYVSASDSFTPCGQQAGLNVRGFTFDAAGQRYALGNGAYDGDFHLLRMSPLIKAIQPASAISSDGTVLYLGAYQSVRAMRIADGIFTERFDIPLTVDRLFVSPAGDWLMAFQTSAAARATRVDLR
jgi:hypothetical protein